ncbi:MAG TPA: hypothetical protein VK175_20355 [Leadbetterella sp.]|nr:hypothetical protein [Leadbetterella sp.]
MSKRTCENGHIYSKSSDCPVCPICEQNKKPKAGFLSLLASPARRALEGLGISKPEDLTEYTKKEILALHGIGPSAIPVLEKALSDLDLKFKA